MTIRGRFFLFVVLIFGMVSYSSEAQVQATNGSIQGDVVDSAGAEVVGAAVEADEVNTATVHKTVTDESGHFSFPSLQPGRYQVRVSKAGFATTIQENLPLTVGLTASLKLTLKVAGTTESVLVTAAPQVDVVTASSTATLNEQTIATTPVLGRKFEDLVTLTPGVSIVQGPDGFLFVAHLRSEALFATALGLVPMSLGIGEGSELQVPLVANVTAALVWTYTPKIAGLPCIMRQDVDTLTSHGYY